MLQRLYCHIAEVFCSGVFPQVITRESLLAAQVGPLFPSLFAISSLGHLKTFFYLQSPCMKHQMSFADLSF
jgi:hypothetical protein